MNTKPMSQTERWQKAGAVLLPHIPVPSPADTVYWQRFPQVEVDRAILRCSRRYAPNMICDRLRPVDAYRYVTYVANEAVKAAQRKQLAQLQFGTPATPPVTGGAEVDDNIGNCA